MPKVHEEEGCKFYIYTNDHIPPHVHVVTGDAVMVLNIKDASLRRATRAKIADIIKAQRLAKENHDKLQKAWDNLFGE